MKRPQHLIKLSKLRLQYVRRFFLVNTLKKFLLKALAIYFIFKQKIALTSGKLKGVRFHLNKRCVLSGRSYAVDLNLKLSRFALRTVVANGLVGGVRRHSW